MLKVLIVVSHWLVPNLILQLCKKKKISCLYAPAHLSSVTHFEIQAY